MTLIFGKRYNVYNLAPCIILVLVCVHVKQAVEIHKRVGAFAMALQTINKCMSDAVCAMARSMLDGESRAAALIHSGNEILETARYSSEARLFSSPILALVECWLFC
jgi:hypothetical protein